MSISPVKLALGLFGLSGLSALIGASRWDKIKNDAYIHPNEMLTYFSAMDRAAFNPYRKFVDQLLRKPLTELTTGIGNDYLSSMISRYSKSAKINANELSFLQNRNNGIGRSLSAVGTPNIMRQYYAGFGNILNNFMNQDMNYRLNALNTKLGYFGNRAQSFTAMSNPMLYGINISKNYALQADPVMGMFNSLTNTLFNTGMNLATSQYRR